MSFDKVHSDITILQKNCSIFLLCRKTQVYPTYAILTSYISRSMSESNRVRWNITAWRNAREDRFKPIFRRALPIYRFRLLQVANSHAEQESNIFTYDEKTKQFSAGNCEKGREILYKYGIQDNVTSLLDYLSNLTNIFVLCSNVHSV